MTNKKTRALQAILEGHTRREAAAAANCSESTLRRWAATDKEFQTTLRQMQDEMLEAVTQKARTAAGQAVDVLQAVMLDSDTQAGTRVQAADKILGHMMKLTEIADIEKRLAVLEAGGEEYGS